MNAKATIPIPLVALLALLAVLAAACGGVDGTLSAEERAGLADLGRCPDPVVIQTDSAPQPEQGALYQLIGEEGRMDPESGRFHGPLAAAYTATGLAGDPAANVAADITVEIRAGGAPVAFQSPLERMVDDPDIFLGAVATDEAIAGHARHPTTAVVAPLDIDPQVLMWDPSTFEIATWAEVKATGATVNHAADAASIEYLVGTGLVIKSQLDDTYDGTPARFVAEGGDIIQQGLATRDPYLYENVLPEWRRPVDYLLIHDAGYEPYPGSLAILDDRFDDAARACLAALVPIVQQAIVDFQRDPAPTTRVILDASAALDPAPELTEEGAARAVIEMGDLGIVGNGPDQAIGDFDLGRVEELIRVTVEQVSSVDVPNDLTVDDLVTNEFIDPDIGL